MRCVVGVLYQVRGGLTHLAGATNQRTLFPVAHHSSVRLARRFQPGVDALASAARRCPQEGGPEPRPRSLTASRPLPLRWLRAALLHCCTALLHCSSSNIFGTSPELLIGPGRQAEQGSRSERFCSRRCFLSVCSAARSGFEGIAHCSDSQPITGGLASPSPAPTLVRLCAVLKTTC
jgi:hypothetical protein